MRPSETNSRGEKIRMPTSNLKESTLEPSYYQQNGQDLIDHLSEIFNADMFIGFMTGNIFKYLTRWQQKNGIEDLKKAQVYLNRLIEFEKQQNQSIWED
ncbi:MAG: DUF3310 domain-containing protein [Lactobacillus sp.]|nr:DUF3310 domain-containing protein [Lactobacillus sp.]